MIQRKRGALAHRSGEARSGGFALDTVQIPLSVLDAHHDSFERHVLPELVRRGAGVIGMKPEQHDDAAQNPGSR